MAHITHLRAPLPDEPFSSLSPETKGLKSMLGSHTQSGALDLESSQGSPQMDRINPSATLSRKKSHFKDNQNSCCKTSLFESLQSEPW